MKQKRFTEEQVITILKEHEPGMKIAENREIEPGSIGGFSRAGAEGEGRSRAGKE